MGFKAPTSNQRVKRSAVGEPANPPISSPMSGNPDILHTEHIVDGAMVAGGAIVKTMNSIERHGLVRAKEDGRLVHVVPKTGDSHAHEILVQATPPVPCACESEIRKYAGAGPHLPDVNGAIGILDEHVVLDSGVVRCVTVVWIFLDVQVGDKNCVKAL